MPCPWVFVAPQAVRQQSQLLRAGQAVASCYSPTWVCACEGPHFEYQLIYFSPRESCLLTKSLGLNGYNKIKSNKIRLMGWDERHCTSSVKDKHIMQLMTQKNILQHLGLFVTSTRQVKWKKKREVKPSPQPARAGEAPSHAVTAFGNKHRHGKVTSRAVISFRARQHETVTHHQQHSCSRHQMGQFMAEMGTDFWGTLPEARSSPPRTSLRQPIYSYGCWVNTHQNRIPVTSTSDWKMLARTYPPGEELDHSIQCMLCGNKEIMSPEEGRPDKKIPFYSRGYFGNVCWQVTQSGGLSHRRVAERGHDLCVHPLEVPEGEEKVSILSGGLTLLSRTQWC